MVQDLRVTTLLGRLGGLYRDPARVDRDASSLLKSSVGIHLTPGISPLVENNGDSAHCLVLQGTIAIVFRGMTYQLLVDIYIPPGYPIRPPVSFVRLAENMYLKESHPHVGSDGMVYLPYTHEWNPRTHSIIEMIVAMSSVFSADPPVFTRAAPPPSPSPPPPAYSSYVSSSNNNSSSSTTSTATATGNGGRITSNDPDRYMQEQIAAIMAKEAEESNHAAEIVRKANREEEEKKQQIEAQKDWEVKKCEQIRTDVNKKIRSYLQNFSEETSSTLVCDWRDQEQLKQTNKQIDQEIQDLSNKKIQMKQHNETIDIKTEDIKSWLEESKDDTTKESDKNNNVDDICQPVNKLNTQMLDLSAESAALTDVMYFLDRGMYGGQIDCTTHLKMIRKLAKRQFLIRAHLIKINRFIANSKN
mmetsp:Transcript_54157/g.60555  ORF Transcript_54157/g.60555 Transcript_54157/m.60555 type:complete len:416 (-) Transcript_54157:38-1285(-)